MASGVGLLMQSAGLASLPSPPLLSSPLPCRRRHRRRRKTSGCAPTAPTCRCAFQRGSGLLRGGTALPLALAPCRRLVLLTQTAALGRPAQQCSQAVQLPPLAPGARLMNVLCAPSTPAMLQPAKKEARREAHTEAQRTQRANMSVRIPAGQRVAAGRHCTAAGSGPLPQTCSAHTNSCLGQTCSAVQPGGAAATACAWCAPDECAVRPPPPLPCCSQRRTRRLGRRTATRRRRAPTDIGSCRTLGSKISVRQQHCSPHSPLTHPAHPAPHFLHAYSNPASAH